MPFLALFLLLIFLPAFKGRRDVTDPLSGKIVTAQDARSYYDLDLADLYAGRTNWNTIGAYPYSPAFAQLVYPLNLLSWPLFVAAWTALLIGAVFLMTGSQLFLLGLAGTVLAATDLSQAEVDLAENVSNALTDPAHERGEDVRLGIEEGDAAALDVGEVVERAARSRERPLGRNRRNGQRSVRASSILR